MFIKEKIFMKEIMNITTERQYNGFTSVRVCVLGVS